MTALVLLVARTRGPTRNGVIEEQPFFFFVGTLSDQLTLLYSSMVYSSRQAKVPSGYLFECIDLQQLCYACCITMYIYALFGLFSMLYYEGS
jgi:hypothetical protein